MTPIATFSIALAAVRGAAAAAVMLSSAALTSTEASAFSTQVKLACASDYFSHCSQHSLGSPELRQCMRSVGLGLSKRCLGALVSAGEVSQSVIEKKSASLR